MTDLLRALSVDIHRDQCGDFPVGAEVIAERPRLTEAPSRVSVRLNEKLEPRTISRWEDDGGYIPTVPRGHHVDPAF